MVVDKENAEKIPRNAHETKYRIRGCSFFISPEKDSLGLLNITGGDNCGGRRAIGRVFSKRRDVIELGSTVVISSVDMETQQYGAYLDDKYFQML